MGNRLTDAIEKQLNRLMAYKEANTPRSTRPKVSPARVIDQGLFGGAVSRIPDEANRLIQRAKAAPAELNALAGPEMAQQVQQAMSNPQPANMQQWLDAGMELSGMAPLGGLMAHTVYHGSPHKFDKFDMSKIGTGEGAQAYGHGLYFAESPAVAKKYADAVEMDLRGKYLGEPLQATNEASKFAQIALDNSFSDIATAAKYAERMSPNAVTDEARQAWLDASKIINELPKFDNAGNLYKVDIPDESIPRMLDWDKPLSEQSPHVQAALANTKNKQLRAMVDYASSPYSTPGLDGEVKTMGEAIKLMGMNASPAKGSALLAKQGIPGIRYLDGNSRGTGGTSNFVLFDDQLPRILEVNGVPTGAQPWAQDAIGLNGKPIDPRGKVRK